MEILQKPGKLSEPEWEIMKSHIDDRLNRPGGGDLAKYLVIAQYSVRFQSPFTRPGNGPPR